MSHNKTTVFSALEGVLLVQKFYDQTFPPFNNRIYHTVLILPSKMNL